MRWSAGIGALVLVAGYVGCGFPSYTYDDNAFYEAGAGASGGSGGSSASGGAAGSDASAGSGGSITGGSGGTSGAGGGTAGAGGGTAGTAGTAGSGGNTGGENCTNGKDDNGNGMIDCADPGCANAGYVCQAVPSGWTGPVALYTGDAAKSLPPCDVTGSYQSPALSAFLNPTVKAQCQCSCGAATGVTCGAPSASLYSAASCGGNSVNADFSAGSFKPGTCVHFSNPADAGTFTSVSANVPSPVAASGGSCAPSQVVVTTPFPWKNKALACSIPTPDSGGCKPSEVCVPPAPSGFGNVCIFQNGDISCPSPSLFTTKYLLYASSSTTDTRSCTTCQCDAPKGNCSGSVELWSSGGCTGTPTTSVDLAGKCEAFASTNSFYADYKIDANQTGVTCAVSASGGQPTGSATGKNPITFCCK